MKLANILLEQSKATQILETLRKLSEEFKDKVETYDDEDVVRVLNRLKDLEIKGPADEEKLLDNIGEFIDGVLDAGDKMEYPFPTLEALPVFELFDFYSDLEVIIQDLIDHIEGNVMYDRRQSA